MFLNRISSPITTGIPVENTPQQKSTVTGVQESTQDFSQILKDKINSISNVNFSKHAVNRVLERNIDISEDNLSRLNEGVKLAEEKGLNEPLILIDEAAYIVNIRNNTVITTVGNDDLKGNVFTNIDGTVII